jgi:hypothetical protein
MTDRTRGSQLTGSQPEAIDLNDLHASKPDDLLKPSSSQAANTDLASASIQSISVVRLSTRPEKRKVASPTLSPTEERATSPDQKRPSTSRPRKGVTPGVLKNPFYKYEGNIFERFITLVANLLKVIEHALLNSFKPQPRPLPTSTVVVKTKRRGPDGREIDEEQEGAEQKEGPPLKDKRSLTVSSPTHD